MVYDLLIFTNTLLDGILVMRPKILHFLVRKRDPSRASLWLLRKLINEGNVNTALSRKSQHTLLTTAARKGCSATVSPLLAASADIEAKNRRGKTALILAAENGHTKIVQALLARGADKINNPNSYNWTPLHWAAANGHTAIVQALIDRGADIEAKTHSHSTALHLAAENGHTKIVQALLAAGVGANIEAKDINSMTALHYAAQKGHTETANALLDKNADREAKALFGKTALHLAATIGHNETVLALIDAEADIEAKNQWGKTALHCAVINGYTATMLTLLNRGADIEAKDNYGWTALHQAAENGDTATVLTLLASGADINATSRSELSALHFADRNGHTEMVQALHDWDAEIKKVNDILKQRTQEGYLPNTDKIKPEALFVVLSLVSLPTLLAKLRNEIDGLSTLSYLSNKFKKLSHNNSLRPLMHTIIRKHIPHQLSVPTMELMTTYIMKAAGQGSYLDKTNETKAEQARKKEKAVTKAASMSPLDADFIQSVLQELAERNTDDLTPYGAKIAKCLGHSYPVCLNE
jgi:ankyrin repeat protein